MTVDELLDQLQQIKAASAGGGGLTVHLELDGRDAIVPARVCTQVFAVDCGIETPSGQLVLLWL